VRNVERARANVGLRADVWSFYISNSRSTGGRLPDAFREAGQWPIGAKGSWRRHSCLPRRDSSRRAWRLPTSTRLTGGCFSLGIYTEPSSAFVVMANPMHILLRPKISPSPSAAIQEG